MEKQPAVYIMAKERNATLYVGVTSNLIARTWQHREHMVEGFTRKYEVTRLVWYELHGTMETAIVREKQIKKWLRIWKMELIEKQNPYWNDLWPNIIGQDLKSLDSRLRGNDEQRRNIWKPRKPDPSP